MTHPTKATPGKTYCVPLRDRGFCRVFVTHTNGKGVCFGYVFGPRIISGGESVSIEESHLMFYCYFGDLGIIKGKWKEASCVDGCNASEWPIRPVYRAGSDGTFRLVYDGDCKLISKQLVAASAEGEDFTKGRDGLFGYGAVELLATHLAKEMELRTAANVDRHRMP